MVSFESILQRSSVLFSVIGSLDQLPQWTALYHYRNGMSNNIYIHKCLLIEKLDWQSAFIELSTNVQESQVRIFHALMANSESGMLIFDYDFQSQIEQGEDGERTVIILDTSQLMENMEFVLKQIDELNKNQPMRKLCVIHPEELPEGAHICLYKGQHNNQ